MAEIIIPPNAPVGYSPSMAGAPIKKEKDIYAILGFIFAFIFPLIGLILSVIALVRINEDKSKGGRGLAIAGIVISIIFPIILIGIISFLMVLNPTELVPNKCTFAVGIGCYDYTLTEDSLMVEIENLMGRDIVLIGASASVVDGNICTVDMASTQVANGARHIINIPCDLGDVGERASVNLELEYYNSDLSPDFVKMADGQIMAKIQ